DRMEALTGVVQALRDAGVEAEDIAVRRPTLDEVFLRLTGHPEDQGRTRTDSQGRTKETV
ncbi:MAG: daunorubicin/doxorubicin resistance ABC transporter ATP-binding protein DrrA, partial [Streptomyces sp.]